MAAFVTHEDVVTFGTYMGMTYQQVWKQHQGYCQWILQTAETGDASPQLRRFATYVVQMEQNFGFQEVQAGSLDEEL